MKRITKESLGTAFQITAIIFIFSYSTSAVKVEDQKNTTDKKPVSAEYSVKLQQRIDSITNNNLHYTESKQPGFLFSSVNMNISGNKK